MESWRPLAEASQFEAGPGKLSLMILAPPKLEPPAYKTFIRTYLISCYHSYFWTSEVLALFLKAKPSLCFVDSIKWVWKHSLLWVNCKSQHFPLISKSWLLKSSPSSVDALQLLPLAGGQPWTFINRVPNLPILLQQFLAPMYTHAFLMQNFKLAENELKGVASSI